jgi:hypothetical protein
MNQLNKLDFTVYVKAANRYSFLNHIEQFKTKNESVTDLFTFYKDKAEQRDTETEKIKERVDRWIKEKSEIIPDKESWEIWRLAKLYDECKEDYENKDKHPDIKNNTLIEEVNTKLNPFDKH